MGTLRTRYKQLNGIHRVKNFDDKQSSRRDTQAISHIHKPTTYFECAAYGVFMYAAFVAAQTLIHSLLIHDKRQQQKLYATLQHNRYRISMKWNLNDTSYYVL